MCLYQVSPGNDPWKWVIKLEKTGRYPNRQRFLVKESHPSPARTSTTASSTTTVLPDPPIPCLAPGAQHPAAAAMDGGSCEPFGDVNKKDGHWTNIMAMVTMIGLNFRLAFVTKCMSQYSTDQPVTGICTQALAPSDLKQSTCFLQKSTGCGPLGHTRIGDVFKLWYDTIQ